MEYLEDLIAREIRPGFFGKMIHGHKTTLAFWDIKKDSVLEEHYHPHEQITYIVEGEMEMMIGGILYLLSAGAVHVIPSNMPHSAIAKSDCRVIDTFSPARDDYR
jgi:quercetin dioxygenase-like cupin family protein